MAKCAGCGGMILFGGVKSGDLTYCNAKCQSLAAFKMVRDSIPPEALSRAVQNVHDGACPECRGPGPVDLHSSHFVWSILILTRSSSKVHLCCRKCALKKQAGSAAGSALVGWWGFPFGLILTPVQIIRNVAAMAGGPKASVPSARLVDAIRTNLAEEAMPLVSPILEEHGVVAGAKS